MWYFCTYLYGCVIHLKLLNYRDTIGHIRERRGSSAMNVPNGLCVVTTCKNMSGHT